MDECGTRHEVLTRGRDGLIHESNSDSETTEESQPRNQLERCSDRADKRLFKPVGNYDERRRPSKRAEEAAATMRQGRTRGNALEHKHTVEKALSLR